MIYESEVGLKYVPVRIYGTCFPSFCSKPGDR